MSVVLIAALLAPPLLALEVGTAPASVKVLPTTLLDMVPQADLHAARGEWESFQVVLRNPTALDITEVTVTDFTGPQGVEIASAGVRLYLEWYLYIDQTSFGGVTGDQREEGWYPDPLIPLVDPWGSEAVALPFTLQDDGQGGALATLYVDVFVPLTATPGFHDASLSIVASDGSTSDVAISIEVWDFEVPNTRTVATAYGFYSSAPRNYHGGTASEPSKDYDVIVDRYYDALHEHRIDVQDIPGSSVDFVFDAKGALEPIDWTAFDAAVGPWLDGTRFADGAGINRFNVGYFSPGRGTGSWTEAQWTDASRAYAEHLEAMGWWDNAYVYSVDEPWLNGGDPTFQAIHDDAQRLFSGTDLWRGHILVTSAWYPQIDGDIGIWCPVTAMYDDWFYIDGRYEGRDFYPGRIAKGEELWFYVCNADLPPFLGYDIDTVHGYEPRLTQWGSWYEQASGFLYWSTTYWPYDDPWTYQSNPDTFTVFAARNGDGFLLYPGDHDGTAGTGSPDGISIDGPILSYRLKQIRDGMEEWEMLRLASELGGEAYVRSQVERAYTQFGNFMVENCDAEGYYCPDDPPWTQDAAILEEVRLNIAAEILYLQDPSSYPDPAGTDETDETGADSADGAKDTKKGCGCATGSPMTGLAGLLAVVLASLRRRSSRSPQV